MTFRDAAAAADANAPAPVGLGASYDRVAGEYAARVAGELAGKPLDRALLAAFAEQVRALGPVCDAGCGPGHVGAFLAALGCDVEGVDLAPGMVAEARRLHPPDRPAGASARLTFRVGDLRALDVADATYGGVVAFYSVIHLAADELGPAVLEWARALRPGGYALVAFHVADAEHRPGEARRLTEWWGRAVDVTFHFLAPEAVTTACADAGLAVEAVLRRTPYAGVEHASERAYVLARRPA